MKFHNCNHPNLQKVEKGSLDGDIHIKCTKMLKHSLHSSPHHHHNIHCCFRHDSTHHHNFLERHILYCKYLQSNCCMNLSKLLRTVMIGKLFGKNYHWNPGGVKQCKNLLKIESNVNHNCCQFLIDFGMKIRWKKLATICRNYEFYLLEVSFVKQKTTIKYYHEQGYL